MRKILGKEVYFRGSGGGGCQCSSRAGRVRRGCVEGSVLGLAGLCLQCLPFSLHINPCPKSTQWPNSEYTLVLNYVFQNSNVCFPGMGLVSFSGL